MKLQKSFKLALNILLHSKLRSWLTIIGIVIGVAAIVAIVSIGEGAQASVNSRLGGLGADIFTVSSGGGRAVGGFRGAGEGGGGGEGGATSTKAKNLTQNDVQVIRSVEGIAFVDGMISGRASMSYLAETASVSVDGVDTQAWSNMETTALDSGRYLDPGDSNDNVIVIGNRISQGTFKQPLLVNSVVTLSTTSQPAKAFKIVGILQSSGSGFGGGEDGTIFMPVPPARTLLDKGSSKLDSISVKVTNADLVDQIVNNTNDRLMLSRHVTDKTKDFSITSAQALQQRLTSVTQTFTIFLAAIAAVSLLVGAVGIANTMFTAVIEKTREIGIMKAIGAKNIDIMLIFLINSGLVGLVGGLIGIILGAAISGILPNFISGLGPLGGRGGLKTVLPMSLLVEAIIVSVSIGMIAGAIPAHRASKLKPVDALRYE